MKQFEEKTLTTRNIFKGKIINLQVDQVSLPDGNIGEREIVKHPGAVAVIPVTDSGKIIFVKQYRKPLERTLVEIPAGKMEPNEKPEITAVRELEEETGYTTDSLTYVTSFYTSPGFADEIMHIYFTNALKKLDTLVLGDEDEFVERMELSLEEAIQYVEAEKIFDAKTAYAVQYLMIKGLK